MMEPMSPPLLTDPASELDREWLARVSAEIARELSTAAPETHLELTDLDPFRLHVDWELAPQDQARARQLLGPAAQQARLVLRFREVESTPERGTATRDAFDRPLDASAGRLEVDVWSPDQSYQAELGLAAADGTWVALVRSNRVRMPPLGPAPLAAVPPTPVLTAATPLPDEAADLDPSLVAASADDLEPVFPNPWPAALTGETAVERLLLDLPAAPLEPGLAALLPDEPLDLSSAMVQLSSAGLVGERPELELYAELHLHGRVPPGHTLRLLGRRVPLKPDGSFQVRQAIASAALLLPLLSLEVKGSPEDA
jgi:hypothetical protein